jgi:hypothetical protein
MIVLWQNLGGYLFVIQKSVRSGSLFMSDSQYVGSPMDRWVRLHLSTLLCITRSLGKMSLDP